MARRKGVSRNARKRRRRAARLRTGAVLQPQSLLWRGVFTLKFPLAGDATGRTYGGFYAGLSYDVISALLDGNVGSGRVWTHVRLISMSLAAPQLPSTAVGGGSYEAAVLPANVAAYLPAAFKDTNGREHPGEYVTDFLPVARLLRVATGRRNTTLGRPLMWSVPLVRAARSWVDRAGAAMRRLGVGGHAQWYMPWPSLLLGGTTTSSVSWKDLYATVEVMVEARCDLNPFAGVESTPTPTPSGQIQPPRGADVDPMWPSGGLRVGGAVPAPLT
nr:hypothetical protein [Grapevine umbra-like virus]